MTDERFIRRYRAAVLGGAAAWRLVLFNPLGARGFGDALEGLVYGLGLGLLPAAALAALAGRVRPRWVLVAATFALFATDATALVLARSSPSSTAGVVVLLAPLLELVTVIPAAVLVWSLAQPGRSG
jgi:hypothetical protein